jgi:mRNA interferase RelE/StbE
MVRFQLVFTPKAELDYANLEPKLQQRVVGKLKMFLENEIIPEKLEGNFRGLFKLRVGDHRIIYELLSSTLMRVRLIGHRSQIYKDLVRELDS